MEYSERYFMNIRGERYFYRAWRVERPSAVVVLLHALGLHTGRYTWLCRDMADMGFACYAVDLYGHGLSDGDRGGGTYGRLLETASTFIRLVEEREGGRVLLLGHGAGAILALSACRAGKAAGVIAISPLAELQGIAHGTLLKIRGMVGLKSRISLRPLRDRHHTDALLEAEADELVNRYVSSRILAGLMKAAGELAAQRLPIIALVREKNERGSQLEALVDTGRLITYDPRWEAFPLSAIIKLASLEASSFRAMESG